MNNDEMEFCIFCIESISEKLSISGTESYKRLSVYSKLLDEYIVPNYEVLHTQGKEYIVNDILQCMKEKGVA